jgi:hypothetical protein
MFERLFQKAWRSSCRFKVAALGVNKRGELLGITFSHPRFCRKGGSIHAEMALIKRYGKRLSKIYICRVNKTRSKLPIHACRVCQKTADSMGIKIIPIHEFNKR